MFGDAGLVDPRSAYHVDLERVVKHKKSRFDNHGRPGTVFFHLCPQTKRQDDFFQSLLSQTGKESALYADSAQLSRLQESFSAAVLPIGLKIHLQAAYQQAGACRVSPTGCHQIIP